MTIANDNQPSEEPPKQEKLSFFALNCGSLFFIAVSAFIGAFGCLFYQQLVHPNDYTGNLGPIAVAIILIIGAVSGAAVGFLLVVVALVILAWKGKI